MKRRIPLICFRCITCLFIINFGIRGNDSQEIIGLSAHFLNATILQVTWNPILPNQTVTGYDAIIVQGDADVRRLSVDNDTTSIEFPNLNQCSNYTVRVAANTSVGIGNYSSFEFLTACAEPPPPPTDLKASIIQSTKVQLEWKPPRQIKVYQINGVTVQIKYASENNAEFINREELDADASGVTLDGLEPDTEYLLRVVSHRFGSPDISDCDHLPLALGLGIPFAFLLLIVVYFMFTKLKHKGHAVDETGHGSRVDGRNSHDTRETSLAPMSLPAGFERKWTEIPRDFLRISGKVGSGACSVVMKGYLMLNNGLTECAVKMLKRHSNEIELRELYNELNIMASVGKHPNIVNLIGACSEGGSLWIVVRFAEKGSLLDYLRMQYPCIYADYQNVTVKRMSELEKLNLALGIARGMSHLAKVKCVHRDLASRNVLLGRNNVPMVSDFGLARDVYESGPYETASGVVLWRSSVGNRNCGSSPVCGN